MGFTQQSYDPMRTVAAVVPNENLAVSESKSKRLCPRASAISIRASKTPSVRSASVVGDL